MSYRKGTKVYFKVGQEGNHKGYRRGIVKQVIKFRKYKEYFVKPTDEGSKPTTSYYVRAKNIRRRRGKKR